MVCTVEALACDLQVSATVLVSGKAKFDEDPNIGGASIMSKLKAAKYATVTEVSHGSRSQKAPRPYTTARLQQDASRFLGFTAKQTMAFAQSLFEGWLRQYFHVLSCTISRSQDDSQENVS